MVDYGVVDHKTGTAVTKPHCNLRYNLHRPEWSACKVLQLRSESYEDLEETILLSAKLNGTPGVHCLLDQHKLSQYDFRLALVRELVTSSTATDRLPRHEQRRSSVDTTPALHLVGRHFHSFIPRTASKEHPKRKCVVCSSKKGRKETVYWCKDCQAALCVVPCFADFHNRSAYNTASSGSNIE